MNNSEKIVLGYPLDLLINRECEYKFYQDVINNDEIVGHPQNKGINRSDIGSIALPLLDNPGTGNIIIRGKPGTAKSTLALQLVIAASQSTVNNTISFFISLEETPENILFKSRQFSWEKSCKILSHVCNLSEYESAKKYVDLLKKILTQPDNCLLLNDPKPESCDTHSDDLKNNSIKSKVLITSLTPRSIFQEANQNNSLFIERYHQLEKLLETAYNYNIDKENVNLPKVRIVCIDSINVFGDDLLTRTQLFRLFDLFKRYKILGVFVVEEDEKNIFHPASQVHGDIIEYLADMVISLSMEKDDVYSLRYFEISKSRYQHQIYGKHPFKIIDETKVEGPIKAIRVFPSLHYLVYATDRLPSKGTPEPARQSVFYAENMEQILPPDFELPKTILIEGPRATLKTYLARDFLMRGLLNPNDTHVIIIRFLDEGPHYTPISQSTEGKLSFRLSSNSQNHIIDLLRHLPVKELLAKISSIDLLKHVIDNELVVNIDRLIANINENELSLKQFLISILKQDANIRIFNVSSLIKLLDAIKKSFKGSESRLALIKKGIDLLLISKHPLINFILENLSLNDLLKKHPLENILNNLSNKEFLGRKFEINWIDDIKKVIIAIRKKSEDIEIKACLEKIFDKDIISKLENLFKYSVDILEVLQNQASAEIYQDLLKNHSIRELLEKPGIELPIFKLLEELPHKEVIKGFIKKRLVNIFWSKTTFKSDDSKKRTINRWLFEDSYGKEKIYTELIVKSGYVLPEEFINIFLEVYNFKDENKPTRIVMDGIGQIGPSYPLLNKSITSGELFLTAFVHIIRNYNLSLLMTGTTGEFDKADNVINQAKTLVDTVLTTQNINVFGDNYVILKGEGLTTSESHTEDVADKVPGAIIPMANNLFKVDLDRFKNLVGFDTDKIERPGVHIYLNCDNEIQTKYIKEINNLLNYAFATSEGKRHELEEVEEVDVIKFNRNESTALHDSLGFLKGNPIKKTVICQIDEFFRSDSNYGRIVDSLLPINESWIAEKFKEIQLDRIKKDEKIYTLPYSDNVLVLAYNSKYADMLSGNELKNNKINSWSELYKIIEQYRKNENNKRVFRLIDFNIESMETLSCLLLDAFFSAHREKEDMEVNTSEFTEIVGNKDKYNNDKYRNELTDLRKIIRLSQKSALWITIDEFDSDSLKEQNKWFDLWIKENKKEGSIENRKKVYEDYQKQIKSDILASDSLFYICWYAELRQLLDNHPELADKIRIKPLPGGGFKGDWHLGILKGSVSSSIGHKVLENLCSEKEDLKRFIRGVGLPTSVRFYNKYNSELNKNAEFLAWPGSRLEPDPEHSKDPQLFNLFRIHEKARERRHIEQYIYFRIMLTTLFQELITIKDEDNVDKLIVKRLPGIIKRLTKQNNNKDTTV